MKARRPRLVVTNVTPMEPGSTMHVYVSTACLHGVHDQCGAGMRERNEPGPPHCKFCPSVCACPDPKCWHYGAVM